MVSLKLRVVVGLSYNICLEDRKHVNTKLKLYWIFCFNCICRNFTELHWSYIELTTCSNIVLEHLSKHCTGTLVPCQVMSCHDWNICSLSGYVSRVMSWTSLATTWTFKLFPSTLYFCMRVRPGGKSEKQTRVNLIACRWADK